MMIPILQGKKTYVLALAALVTAWGTYFTGDATMQTAIEATFAALGGIFLRDAIGK